MNITKKLFIKILTFILFCSSILIGSPQKIAIGGLKTAGITNNESIDLKEKIDSIIKNTDGFSLINSNTINKKINQSSKDLLDCISDACSHEISHIFGLNAVISGDIKFHENGVDIKVNLFSHQNEKTIITIKEEHAPLKLTAVIDLLTETYIPELLKTYSKIVKPNIQIIEPAKFYSIPENNNLRILLNLSDNNGLQSYTVKYSNNGGNIFQKVKSGQLNNELTKSNFTVLIPLTHGITKSGMIQVSVTDIDGNKRVKNSELFTVEDNTPPSISLINPTKSEIIKGSNDYNISWDGKDNLGIQSFELLISTDDSDSYNSLVKLNGTTKDFIWTVPDLLTNTCYLKLIATDFTGLKTEDIIGPLSVMDGSPPKFTILTSLKDKSFPEKSEIEINLNLKDNTGVKVVEAYFTKNKIDFELLHQSIFNKLIKNKNKKIIIGLPNGITSNAQIKWVVKDLFENETSLYTSQFTISDNTPPINDIVYPVSGVILNGLEKGKIIWSSSDNSFINSHEIYFSTNNGKSWQFIGKTGGDKNNIIWNIPDVNSNTVKIKIITKDSVGLTAESITDVFEIKDVIVPKIELITPENLTIFKERDTVKFKIKISDNIGINSSQVYLKIGSQSHNINSKIFTSKTKSAIIEFEKVLRAMPDINLNLFIVVTDIAGNQTNFKSNEFRLKDNTPPSITFLTQLSGVTIDGISNFKMDWNARDNAGIKSISFQYTSNGGNSWEEIINFKSKKESHIWQVPNLHSNKCKLKLKIEDINGFKNEVTSSMFSIRDITGPNLTVIAPLSGETYKEQEIVEVAVIAQDEYGLGLVELYFSTNGNDFNYLSNEAFTNDVTEDTVKFTIKIPEGMSDKTVFKFIGVDRFNNENEITSNPFKVIDNTPPIVHFSMNLPSNEVGTGKAIIINWDGGDNFKLKSSLLEYSVDNGEHWGELYKKQLKGKEYSDSFTWLIPTELENNCQVKITLEDEMGLVSTDIYSDLVIIDQTIPSILFKSEPNNSVNETRKYSIDLILRDNHSINSVDFYYAQENQHYIFINSESELEGTNFELNYELQIPKGYSNSALVKIILTDKTGNSNEITTSPFKVIDFTNPEISINLNIPTKLKNGENYELSWESSDNEAINSHLIEFSLDNGNNWKNLATLPGSQNKWGWKVPKEIITNEALIRMIVIDHVDLKDTSNTNLFSIIDKINPNLFIPLSKYKIEINENDTLNQSFQISDNIQISNLIIEYSNIPRKFNIVKEIDFSSEHITTKSINLAIPIPPGTTKNAKLKATLTDISGNSVTQTVKGIRIIDNTPPNVKFLEPISFSPDSSILVVGDTIWFQWDSNDNTGIRSNRISYRIDGSYWKPILTTKGDESKLSWKIPEHASGQCEFQIITTDKVGLQNEDIVGPFKVKDILNETRSNHLRKYGTLSIDSNPAGAMVLIDNIEKGYTPIQIENLTDGNHRLVLYKRRFKHISKIISIQPDSILSINEKLEGEE
jgi:hypothetical protein